MTPRGGVRGVLRSGSGHTVASAGLEEGGEVEAGDRGGSPVCLRPLDQMASSVVRPVTERWRFQEAGSWEISETGGKRAGKGPH